MESFVNVGACGSVANLQMTNLSFILAVCLGYIFYSAKFSDAKRKFLFRFLCCETKVSLPVYLLRHESFSSGLSAAKRKFLFRFLLIHSSINTIVNVDWISD